MKNNLKEKVLKGFIDEEEYMFRVSQKDRKVIHRILEMRKIFEDEKTNFTFTKTKDFIFSYKDEQGNERTIEFDLKNLTKIINFGLFKIIDFILEKYDVE